MHEKKLLPRIKVIGKGNTYKGDIHGATNHITRLGKARRSKSLPQLPIVPKNNLQKSNQMKALQRRKSLDRFSALNNDTSLSSALRLKKKRANLLSEVEFKFDSLESEFTSEVEEINHLLIVIKKKKRERLLAWRKNVNSAATKINKFLYKHFRALKRKRKHNSIIIQKVWRGYAEKNKVKTYRVALKYNRMVYSYLQQNRLQYIRNQAAKCIYKKIKAYVFKKRLNNIIQAKKEKLLKSRIDASEKIHTFARYHIKRRRETKEKLQQIIKARGIIGSFIISCIYKRKKKFANQRKIISAMKIQKLFRNFMLLKMRKKAKEMLLKECEKLTTLLPSMSENVQLKAMAQFKTTAPLKNYAATRIQKTFRGHSQRKKIDAEGSTSIKRKMISKPLKRRGGGYELDAKAKISNNMSNSKVGSNKKLVDEEEDINRIFTKKNTRKDPLVINSNYIKKGETKGISNTPAASSDFNGQ